MTASQNHLIELLPQRDRQRLLAACETVELRLSERLVMRGEPIRHAYFPIDGFISLVAQLDQHPTLEVGMIGREGMLGAQLVLGMTTSPLQALVQGGGTALRIGARELQRELVPGSALRRCLDRYLYVRMVELAGSAACVRFHQIGPRLARWLLMSQDRAHADHFRMTHEFLACMLGVRRVGITVAASSLQRMGLISYQRGEIVVRRRAGLEAAACSCYASDLRAYAALL